eukprot:3919863-Amphidinium_carterae.1
MSELQNKKTTHIPIRIIAFGFCNKGLSSVLGFSKKRSKASSADECFFKHMVLSMSIPANSSSNKVVQRKAWPFMHEFIYNRGAPNSCPFSTLIRSMIAAVNDKQDVHIGDAVLR